MKIGKIYLISSLLLSYKVVKVLKIKNEEDVSYEIINIHFKIYGKEYESLHELEKSIIRPLNKKVWYKLIRRLNESRGNIFN